MECIDLTLDDNTGPRAAATAGSEDVVCIEIDSQEKDAYAEECRTKAPSVVNCSGTVGKERILRSVAQREEIMAETKAKLARVAQIRRELERSDSCFSDEDFPADASSIDGRNKLSSVRFVSFDIGGNYRPFVDACPNSWSPSFFSVYLPFAVCCACLVAGCPRSCCPSATKGTLPVQ